VTQLTQEEHSGSLSGRHWTRSHTFTTGRDYNE